MVHNALAPHVAGSVQGSKHCPDIQAKSFEQWEFDLHPVTQIRSSQTSSSEHCSSDVQAYRQTPELHRSPCKHSDPSIVHAGLQRSSSHLQPLPQSVCIRHASDGVRTHAMLGVGLGIKPSIQEHEAFLSTTEHKAFGPHGLISLAHGFWQKLFLQNSSGPQSSSCRHPY